MQRASEAPLLMSSGNPFNEIAHMDSIISSVYGWRRLAKMKKTLRQGEHTHTHTVVSRCTFSAKHPLRLRAILFEAEEYIDK